jgi:hypothetical protein
LAVPSSIEPTPATNPTRRVFRLPRSAYLVVLFLLFGTLPLAFGDSQSHSADDVVTHVHKFAGVAVGWFAFLLVLPVIAAFYIARTATFVDGDGIRVRAVFGSRRLGWSEIRGLSVSGRSVYAVVLGGGVRLPCVRVNDLAEVARHSGGHLPQLRDPVPHFAPARRRR